MCKLMINPMKKRKIILISAVVIVIIAVISVFAPVSVDKFIWGDSFKESVAANNLDELDFIIAKANIGQFLNDSSTDEFLRYYYSSYETDDNEDSYGKLELGQSGEFFKANSYKDLICDSVSWKGRHIYMSAFFEYNGKIHEIKFEGTRWFFGQYSWEMLDNEFFPIEDENFINTPEVVYKKP